MGCHKGNQRAKRKESPFTGIVGSDHLLQLDGILRQKQLRRKQIQRRDKNPFRRQPSKQQPHRDTQCAQQRHFLCHDSV